ncbi:adenosylhomocysteinase [Cryptosporangium sp. NPDC051539]|uniref:adenosylhomocysteinase n=1 Tax=Cryptosporangium sp. NPDC051539 TaxID=3363962 RepID=UPI0037B9558A
MQHDVADLGLAAHGHNRIEWADRSMPVLRAIRDRFTAQRPFEGVRIAACLNITAETANLVRTLQAGGAEIRLCASNPLSTQDDTAAALVSEFGVSVFARHRSDVVTYREHLDAVLARPPDLVLDDACDLATALHTDYQDLIAGLRGGCEETTSGVVRLRAMASAGGLRYPVVAVTDTPTKNLVDNRIGTGQSTIDALLRSTNTLLAGAKVVVAGFGYGGQGVAARLTGLGARVIVTEVDPARALDATLSGYAVMTMAEAAPVGDVFITVTGNRDVIRAEHFALMKDGAVLANAGHFDLEIDVAWLAANAVDRHLEVRPHVDEYVQEDGRRLLLVAEGRVANLAGAEGHPAAVMDVAFGIQALSAEWLLHNQPGSLPAAVLEVPPGIDREIARLKLAALDVNLDVLNETQLAYLTSWSS